MLDRYFANREEKCDVTKIQIYECGIGWHFHKERNEKDPLTCTGDVTGDIFVPEPEGEVGQA